MNLCNYEEISYLLKGHGFHFSKSLGQNFLIESWVPEDIVASSKVDKTCGVLEIGAGIGCLTKELSAQAGKVVCVELDSALFPILGVTLVDCKNVELVHNDILNVDLKAFVETHFQGLTPVVVANLPYNITSPVLSALMESGCFASVTVMIQKEVAERITCGANTSNYGGFSVYCQYHCDTEFLFEVPPTCFMPAPKVTSAVIRMVPKAPPTCVDDPTHFFKLVKAGFAQRRKTLVNSVSSTMNQYSKEDVARALEVCGIRGDVRGQGLSIEEFARLSKVLRGVDVG